MRGVTDETISYFKANQPKIIVNQHVSTMCIVMGKKARKLKTKKNNLKTT